MPKSTKTKAMYTQPKLTKELEATLGLISIPMIENTELYSRNQERAYEQDLEACPCCGKALKNPKYFIHSAYGGAAFIPQDKTDYADTWIMYVGSECRKRFPSGYVFEVTAE